MRINEMVRLQEGLKKYSTGKNQDVFRMLMGQKDDTPVKKAAKDTYIPAGGSQPRPDWTSIPTKSAPAMSEAEFEKSIRTLYLEYAERATEIGNSGQSKSVINKRLYDLDREFEVKGSKLQTLFVSVVSPDRKAAYANTKYDGSSYFVVHGNEQNFLGRNELMTWSSNSPKGWTIYPTSAEHARMSKYGQIRLETLNAYEAEHGQIPHTTISKSFTI